MPHSVVLLVCLDLYVFFNKEAFKEKNNKSAGVPSIMSKIPRIVHLLLYAYYAFSTSRTTSTLCLEIPFYVCTFNSYSLNFFVFDAIVIGILVLCLIPAKRLDYLKKVVISGFGVFMSSGHLLYGIVPDKLKTILWFISITLGVIAGALSLTERYENTFYTIVGSHITSYIIVVLSRSHNIVFYFITLVVFIGVYFVMFRVSPVYHYAVCKSLFVGIVFLTFVDINFSFIDPFKGFHGTKGEFFVNGMVGLVMFFLSAVISFALTLYYDKVKEKVGEYREVAVQKGFVGGKS